ncbi:MAG TPA: hypothetical protein PKJ08_04940 [Candidatus Cloacimonadota bacterium]|jgi:hypothetical protein|nr:hypothetical protein [Candidatus Cloacimonadota bacterium]HPO60960.1 hypothetical protein [Exilispira sp.]
MSFNEDYAKSLTQSRIKEWNVSEEEAFSVIQDYFNIFHEYPRYLEAYTGFDDYTAVMNAINTKQPIKCDFTEEELKNILL